MGEVGTLPGPLSWYTEPASFTAGSDGLTSTCDAATDWFVDPAGIAVPKMDAPAALFTPPDEAFHQSPTGSGCSVTFDRVSYRAGVLADLRSGE